ncbi:hypothetical protein PSHT_15587 [Puccinia striiformis]|uniref:Zn(2)-C6 fungal-type domain-containing protein n=1 Tax=Puccinia striiformis TaxID=27350 RepID=A0A2S4UE39_9BASI|nr:hypothetical protein PSHT_15587 [Puccinia striiformis]
MIAVPPRCDGCRRRDEDCIPSSATRGDRTKCEGCRRRRVPCTFTYNPQNSTTSTDRGNIRNPTTTTDRSRRTENNSIVRRPGIDYDIELIRDDFNIFAPYRRYTTCFPVPPPRYDEPDPIVLVESLANRATTPPNREIPQLVVPHHMIKEEEAKKKKEEELKKKRDEERRQSLEGAIRRREEEAKKKEEENEAMRLRGEAIRRSVQEEVDRREVDNRIPILEAEMNRSTIDEAGARIDSGGDYVMKEKNKEVETDARRLTSDVGEGCSSMIRKRRLDADVDSIQPKKSKKCRESKISDRFEEFYAMQLLILKKMGVYVDEEDIEEFKDLIKDINEGLILLEEDIKKM